MLYIIKFKILLPIIRLISFVYRNNIIFSTKEFIYQVPKNFNSISKFLMRFNLYEKKERSLVSKLLNNTNIIEAGGGIGLISMYLKKKVANKKLVILEPNRKMNDLILNNFEINKINLKNIKILNYALSYKNKKKERFFTYEIDMANSISKKNQNYNFKKKKTEFVDTISLNSLIKKFKINNFQLVMDIEGEELNVLTKKNRWIKNCLSILVENHLSNPDLKKLNKYIENKGFKLIDSKENVYLFMKESYAQNYQ